MIYIHILPRKLGMHVIGFVVPFQAQSDSPLT